jgi:hypothetical protein
MDIVFIGLIALCVGLAGALVHGCDKLGGRP